ncbi:hypothetical protein QAD02_005185 [Eretmocerus hayati]|uniref:Uncharacterized protein n=1 Tax=Eretmocerus hayati TaxID=131215 RepID=A0ACC2NSW1_9HYME|nr:hypothetical protein QAD02_005185 [Eretmocerus hayati]
MTKQNQVFLHLITILLFWSYSRVDCLRGGKVEDATLEDSRSIVYIGNTGKYNGLNIQKTFCTGVFITKVHVLTLSNCIEMCGNKRFGVFGGCNQLYRTSAYHVSGYVMYNDWAILHGKTLLKNERDIVIITVSNPEIDPHIRPVNLPNFYEEFYGMKVSVMGLGETEKNIWPVNLQKAELKLMTKQECKTRVTPKMTEEVENGEILCSEPPPQIVNKDRGGPLLDSENTLVGLNIIPRNIGLWAKLKQPVNVHVKIHPSSPYREFICHLVGHLLVNEDSNRSSNAKPFCYKEPNNEDNEISAYGELKIPHIHDS